jgi:hypothetical protein
MYYAIEIGSSLFLSCYFRGFPELFSASGIFRIVTDVLDVDLSSLFIVREPLHRV